MRISAVVPAALAALVLHAPLALSQELGLDLSQPDTSAPQEGGMELDLRSDDPKTELMPRFVLVGLDAPERAGAQQAPQWLRELLKGALSSGMVTLGANPREVRERLEAGYAAAVKCTAAACLAEAAEALDADLLTTARLSLEDAGWTLRTWTYDRDRGAVHEEAVEGRNPKDAAFLKEATTKLSNRMMALARPRAVLTVKVNVPQAVVKVGERILGVGNVESRLPPGTLNLEVSADEYSTFTRTLTLKPGGRESVDVRLEISGPAPEGPGDDAVARAARGKNVSILKRPAFYTAIVGLVAVGVGAMIGKSAKDVEKRAIDGNGDGIYDVSRKEVQDAKSQATLGSALMAGGGAVAAGSALWLVLVPARVAPTPSTTLTPGRAGGASSTSLNLVFGGSF